MGVFGRKSAGPMARRTEVVVPMRQSFDPQKFKNTLRVVRVQLERKRNKLENSAELKETEIAKLLGDKREGTAKTKAEQNIRERLHAEAMEICVPFCELLQMRYTMFDPSPHALDQMPVDLREAVCSLVYGAPRFDSEELVEVVNMLKNKYGEDNMDMIARCEGPFATYVNSDLVRKLNIMKPEGYLVLRQLEHIAHKHEVPWKVPAEYEQLENRSITSLAYASYGNSAPTAAAMPRVHLPPTSAVGAAPYGGGAGGYAPASGGYYAAGRGAAPDAYSGGGYPPSAPYSSSAMDGGYGAPPASSSSYYPSSGAHGDAYGVPGAYGGGMPPSVDNVYGSASTSAGAPPPPATPPDSAGSGGGGSGGGSSPANKTFESFAERLRNLKNNGNK